MAAMPEFYSPLLEQVSLVSPTVAAAARLLAELHAQQNKALGELLKTLAEETSQKQQHTAPALEALQSESKPAGNESDLQSREDAEHYEHAIGSSQCSEDEDATNDFVEEEELTEIPGWSASMSLQVTELESGTENEEELFSQRSKLYRFCDGEWKERAMGDSKLLRHKITGKIRFLLRQEKTFRLRANHYVIGRPPYGYLAQSVDSESTVVWSTPSDFADEEPEHAQFALRFSNADLANKFREAFEKARDLNAVVPDIQELLSEPNERESGGDDYKQGWSEWNAHQTWEEDDAAKQDNSWYQSESWQDTSSWNESQTAASASNSRPQEQHPWQSSWQTDGDQQVWKDSADNSKNQDPWQNGHDPWSQGEKWQQQQQPRGSENTWQQQQWQPKDEQHQNWQQSQSGKNENGEEEPENGQRLKECWPPFPDHHPGQDCMQSEPPREMWQSQNWQQHGKRENSNTDETIESTQHLQGTPISSHPALPPVKAPGAQWPDANVPPVKAPPAAAPPKKSPPALPQEAAQLAPDVPDADVPVKAPPTTGPPKKAPPGLPPEVARALEIPNGLDLQAPGLAKAPVKTPPVFGFVGPEQPQVPVKALPGDTPIKHPPERTQDTAAYQASTPVPIKSPPPAFPGDAPIQHPPAKPQDTSAYQASTPVPIKSPPPAFPGDAPIQHPPEKSQDTLAYQASTPVPVKSPPPAPASSSSPPPMKPPPPSLPTSATSSPPMKSPPAATLFAAQSPQVSDSSAPAVSESVPIKSPPPMKAPPCVADASSSPRSTSVPIKSPPPDRPAEVVAATPVKSPPFGPSPAAQPEMAAGRSTSHNSESAPAKEPPASLPAYLAAAAEAPQPLLEAAPSKAPPTAVPVKAPPPTTCPESDMAEQTSGGVTVKQPPATSPPSMKAPPKAFSQLGGLQPSRVESLRAGSTSNSPRSPSQSSFGGKQSLDPWSEASTGLPAARKPAPPVPPHMKEAPAMQPFVASPSVAAAAKKPPPPAPPPDSEGEEQVVQSEDAERLARLANALQSPPPMKAKPTAPPPPVPFKEAPPVPPPQEDIHDV